MIKFKVSEEKIFFDNLNKLSFYLKIYSECFYENSS